MCSTFIHFQTLHERVVSHPNTPVFKIPKPGTCWGDPEWIDVSYTQFNADIERLARYWYATLGSHNIPLRSVIGVWYMVLCEYLWEDKQIYIRFRLRGFSYADAVTIYSISRAGYVPQMFGFELPNTRIIFALLASSSGRAIIHHPSKATLLAHGSVSGMPKAVPTTNKWLSTIQHKSTPAYAIGYEDYKSKDMGQDIYLWTLVSTKPARVGRTYAEYASSHLHWYATETDLEAWANEIRIPLTNVYGSTECGQLMSSTLTSPYFELLPNTHAEFVPIRATLPSNSIQNDARYISLLELHIMPTSPDLPILPFRLSTGGWLSGDFFEEVSPGKYIFRGRDDDWIKSFLGDRLDTKTIENEVYNVCGFDLVANCVVVGYGRPWPMLFVELKPGVLSFEPESITETGTAMALQQVKEEIIKRLENFNSLRYLHEHVEDPRMVYIVLPPRKLPRTAVKRNIRRHGVEQEFAQEIEAAYTSMPVDVFDSENPLQ
ncbi:hypothetical protein Clacol_002247 [Clathrus columnatus]|uniref:Uncharacterized protein n=1 Tax=Clathrus columnatus TaxID=1419009 RepID=A0AAV5A1A1_9AGAM|nr:hypothetical protein Clacol_002247 [Clathrus columnatus]